MSEPTNDPDRADSADSADPGTPADRGAPADAPLTTDPDAQQEDSVINAGNEDA